jgi:hypothetical protein
MQDILEFISIPENHVLHDSHYRTLYIDTKSKKKQKTVLFLKLRKDIVT